MQNLAQVILKNTNINLQQVKGSGAAGGVGGALYAFLQGNIVSGVHTVIKLNQLEEQLKNSPPDSSLIITGEGKIDHQSLNGKVITGIAKLAAQYNIPVIAIAGKLESDIPTELKKNIQAMFSIINEPMDLSQSLTNTGKMLEQTVENIVRLWCVGQ